jgi:hypothetical protein
MRAAALFVVHLVIVVTGCVWLFLLLGGILVGVLGTAPR